MLAALAVLGALAWQAAAATRADAAGDLRRCGPDAARRCHAPPTRATEARAGSDARRCSPAGIRALRGTARVERTVRCLLNARRAAARLRPLRYDRCLDRAAERHARDMVHRRYFAHSSWRGRTPAQRAQAAGYVPRRGSWRIGENLAWGAGQRATARAAVRGWLRSPPHRANVLAAAFRDVGVAVVRGAPVRHPRLRGRTVPTATFVVAFGARSGRACGERRGGARAERRGRKGERRGGARGERRGREAERRGGARGGRRGEPGERRGRGRERGSRKGERRRHGAERREARLRGHGDREAERRGGRQAVRRARR
ncbi:CAP domain-containing protein [Conexibacter arvalis]|uniref:Uncharacterized protein YkwD n=1 Tax=Conexibacter arvalis TaxID=912552 RepID=A0A840II69_9ACTN|nr:uncharacterized protein YkwD [Conexibacter arvalis]